MYKATIYICLTFVALAVLGCTHVRVDRLTAYDQALNLAGPERPKLFYANNAKIDTAMTPYANMVAYGGGDRETMIRSLWQKAAELKADIVIIQDGGSQYVGSTAYAMPMAGGSAMAMSVPMYQNSMFGWCLRRNQGRVGFQTDETSMIIDITNDYLRAAGVVEGDKVVSINGLSYDRKNGTPELMNLNPDSEATIVVIRPGVGKLEKKVRVIKNDPTYLNYSDAIAWEAPKWEGEKQENSKINEVHKTHF